LGAEPAIDLTPGAADQSGPVNAPSASGQYVRVPIERLDELVRFVSELLVNRSTFEQYLGAYGQEVRELNLSIDRLKRISQRLDTDIEVTSLRGGLGQLAVRGVMMTGKVDKRGEFDLLEFDRYTDLHLVSRDLSETAVDVTAAAAELRSRAGDFDSYLGRLSRLTSDIQDRLMRLRMVPLAALSTRLHRTVRVTAERTGKQVDFRIEGDRIELDKTVLEEMAGPIEHALRNAIDHGIESETLRRAMGKPARGRLVLEARYEGTQVVLSISDDGAGINPELIRSAAVDRGLISEAEAAQMSDDRVLDIIFQPGFSTARQVSEVSGRGVGMDVVKSTVTRLKGTVELTSSPGSGTRLIVRLPMTLAIMRVLLVKTRQETYALPANVVTRILRIGADSIEELGGKTILRHEGKVCPLVRLGDALRLNGTADQPLARRPALMVQIGGQTVALVVDEVIDAREVVVKTLGTLLRKVRGFTGATLMGDGSVVLILNPADLVESRSAKTAQLTPAAKPAANRSLEILTVDDSVSVRRVLAKLIENAGWRPTPAKDGLEALELLQRGLRPDAILLDVEMPRMDGYELLGALRGMPHLRDVPVVMLTSRAGEKHRKKAFELGATDYLVKPYQDETLLAVVRRVVREAKETAVR
jgi:chemosensory pili system protein ChpA (sensor histidine kinase/response regulator)